MHQMTHALPRALPRGQTTDPRWTALGIAQAAMDALALRDRDIAVLRGLLSFIPADRWTGPLVVFASNTALQNRCDGMDERTLRRRLARLCEVGLIRRQQSPNRKRFTVRDANGDVLLSYGFDLAPLRQMLSELQAIASDYALAQRQIKALKSVLRDRLYKLSMTSFRTETNEVPLSEFQRLLRRKASVDELERAIKAAEVELEKTQHAYPDASETSLLTDSVGQTDRDIQSSSTEYLERKAHDKDVSEQPNPRQQTETLENCLQAAPSCLEFAEERPRNWYDLTKLAHQLAPAIGIGPHQLQQSTDVLGHRGAALAILGLVEAFPRIRDPKRYLSALLSRAASVGLDIDRMFRSLTGWSRFPAGNPNTP